MCVSPQLVSAPLNPTRIMFKSKLCMVIVLPFTFLCWVFAFSSEAFKSHISSFFVFLTNKEM